jgi:hypothetical protein
MSDPDEVPPLLALRLAAPISQDAAATALAGHACWRERVATLLGIDLAAHDLSDGKLFNCLKRRFEGDEKKSTDPVIDEASPRHVVPDHLERVRACAGVLDRADLWNLVREVESLRREVAMLRGSPCDG